MRIGSRYRIAAALVALAMSSLSFRSGADRHSTRNGDRDVAPPCNTATDDAAKALCAARTFLATLNDSERSVVIVPFTGASARRWSNLPYPLAHRNGLLLRMLNGEQRDAAMRLATAALSASGIESLRAIRKADALLARQPDRASRLPGGKAGPPPDGKGSSPAGNAPGVPNELKYGENNYVVAFVGAPSDTAPWMLQFGGHHLAINIMYHGKTSVVSATPDFVGVEPQHFTIDGVGYAPLDGRKAAMYAMLGALNDDQRSAARLGLTFDDVLVGPGRDGQFPAPQGLPVRQLNRSQRALVRRAIEAWVGDAPDSLAQALIRDYTSDSAFSNTRVAWSGATEPTVVGSYVRIDGPRVWIEFVCQAGIVFTDQIHFHTIWRDKSRDYGGSFTFDAPAPGGSRVMLRLKP